jgi:hypothetical protein
VERERVDRKEILVGILDAYVCYILASARHYLEILLYLDRAFAEFDGYANVTGRGMLLKRKYVTQRTRIDGLPHAVLRVA